MGSGSDGYIGTDHHRIPDPDMGIVHQCQVKVGVNVMSKVGIASPVGVKGRLDVTAFSDFCQQFLKELLAFYFFGGAGLVKIV